MNMTLDRIVPYTDFGTMFRFWLFHTLPMSHGLVATITLNSLIKYASYGFILVG